ncbi:MAG: hypothetical protein ACREXX_01005 [Gammaproteobacteria bacterium]
MGLDELPEGEEAPLEDDDRRAGQVECSGKVDVRLLRVVPYDDAVVLNLPPNPIFFAPFVLSR